MKLSILLAGGLFAAEDQRDHSKHDVGSFPSKRSRPSAPAYAASRGSSRARSSTSEAYKDSKKKMDDGKTWVVTLDPHRRVWVQRVYFKLVLTQGHYG